MAAFFAKSGKSKLTPFFEKLEELLKQFKEFLKKKEKSPDTPDVDKKKGTPQKKSTKSADDMTEGISKNQKKVIDDVESGKTKLEGYKGHKKGNHTRKSNYGEMKMDQKMKELGHEPIGVYFLTELNDNKQYSLATMPAVNFDMVLNESFKKDMWELVEVATLIIGLIPVLKVGVSALVKTISAIDVAIMAAAIIVDRNKDSLPGWFRESFGYIETASIGLILVGNPRHLLKAEQQLAKLDGHIANLSKAQRAIPGLENALFALRETLEEQINFGKRVAKSDESTLRKLITEVSESTMDGTKKRELLEALNEQLRTVTKKAVSGLDEAAYRQKQISDALINQGQEAVNITKKADMTAPVITKTEKTGEAILDGNSIILKSADGAEIARPLFRSTDEALAWLEYSKKSRFSDARHIDELEPKMHPWFFDSNGKKLLAESHPHLYDGERPRSLSELFSNESKLIKNAEHFEFLQSLGSFRKADNSSLEEIADLFLKTKKHVGDLNIESFKKILVEEGVELTAISDDVLEEIVRKSNLYISVVDTTKRQKDFTKSILQKHLSGEIDDELAQQLIQYNRLNRSGIRSIDNVIEEFRQGKVLSSDGLFKNPNIFERSSSFRKENFTALRALGVNIPKEFESLFQAHHIILFSFKNDAKFGPFLEKIGFKIDDGFQNGLPLLADDFANVISKNPDILNKFPDLKIWQNMPKHLGSHSSEYAEYIKENLNVIYNKFLQNNNSSMALRQVEKLITNIITGLEEGTLKLNK